MEIPSVAFPNSWFSAFHPRTAYLGQAEMDCRWGCGDAANGLVRHDFSWLPVAIADRIRCRCIAQESELEGSLKYDIDGVGGDNGNLIAPEVNFGFWKQGLDPFRIVFAYPGFEQKKLLYISKRLERFQPFY